MSIGHVSDPAARSSTVLPASYGIGCDEAAARCAGSKKTQAPALTVGEAPAEAADGLQAAVQMGLAQPGEFSPSDAALFLTMLQTKLNDYQLQTASGKVQDIQKQQAEAAAKRRADLEKNIAKMKHAEKAGVFAKVFGWIASAAMIIAGALLTVAGGSGTALLVGGITAMSVMALQQTGAMDKMLNGLASLFEKAGLSRETSQILATVIFTVAVLVASLGAGSAGGAAAGVAVGSQLIAALLTPENLEKMGLSESVAPWLAMGLSVGLSLLALGSGLGSAVQGGVQKTTQGIAKVLQNLLTKITSRVADMTEQSLATLQRGAALMSATVQLCPAAASVGGGIAQGAGAVYGMEATNASAAVKKDEAAITLAKRMFDAEREHMQDILARIQAAVSEVTDMLGQESVVNKRILSA